LDHTARLLHRRALLNTSQPARFPIPAAFATTLILHDNSVVGSATRQAPPQVTVSRTAEESLSLDARSGLRESCSRRGRRDFGGPIPSRNILAQQEGDRGYACATGGSYQLTSRTCWPRACALDQRLGEGLWRTAGPVTMTAHTRATALGGPPCSQRIALARQSAPASPIRSGCTRSSRHGARRVDRPTRSSLAQSAYL
jgi:hypothetical protein